jgi:hypothetical protein
MKRARLFNTYIFAWFAAAALAFGTTQAMACTPTGFVRDAINLTAALINPHGSLDGDIDASGCNIGVYYGAGAKGSVNGASIHGANYFGVVNNGARVDVKNSTIYDIGEQPLNGSQHGVAIYFASNSAAKGDITGNTMWSYQKGGIVVLGPSAKSDIRNNTVIGEGPVNYIAQNGIEVGFGADADIRDNLVVGNSYTGANRASSGGILVFGGDCFGGALQKNTKVEHNTLVGNDVGVWFVNLDSSCNPATTVTRNTAKRNTIRNNAVNNTTGDYDPSNILPGCTATDCGYQAGIADQGDEDLIYRNSICGVGYTPVVTPPPYLFMIDVSNTTAPIVEHNTSCSTSGPVTDIDVDHGSYHHHHFHPSMYH